MNGRYAFGPFELSQDGGELWKSTEPLKLAPQPLRLLALLVSRPGELVTRDELRAALWPDGTTVEFDQGLNYCIRQVRIALEDDAKAPRYIETVPKRGYRFLAEVRSSEPAVPIPVPEAQPIRRRGLGVWLWAAAALLTVTASAWWLTSKKPELEDPHAWATFKRAQVLVDSWERKKVEAAAADYRAVLKAAPDFAPAWAGLATSDVILAFGGEKPADFLRDAETHARKALEVDPGLAAAHAVLGHALWQQWRWSDAEAEFRKALDLDPNCALAHQLYGMHLASLAHNQAAREHARRATELAPTSGLFEFSLAQVSFQAGDYEGAIHHAERAMELDRHFPLSFALIARAQIQLGRFEEAQQTLRQGLQHYPEGDGAVWQKYLDARLGTGGHARVLLKNSGHSSLGRIAAVVAAGDYDTAFAALEASIAAHVPSMIWLRTAPELAPLRKDPKFSSLLVKHNRKF